MLSDRKLELGSHLVPAEPPSLGFIGWANGPVQYRQGNHNGGTDIMTVEELKAAGFYEMCEGIPSSIGRWDSGFQRRIRDRHGTRYFIGCYLWRHSKLGPFDDDWEVEVQFVEGCNWLPSKTCVRITAWNGVSSWTPADVLAWANGVWERMKPAHYEGGNTMTNEQTDRDVVIAQQAEARASAELMAANVQLSGFIVRSCRRQLPPSPTDPCPWCQHASPYLTDADNPMIQVTCGKCGACGPLMANETAAVEAWNRIGSNTAGSVGGGSASQHHEDRCREACGL